MENYAGIDVSLELSSVCVVDAQGKILKEGKITKKTKRKRKRKSRWTMKRMRRKTRQDSSPLVQMKKIIIGTNGTRRDALIAVAAAKLKSPAAIAAAQESPSETRPEMRKNIVAIVAAVAQQRSNAGPAAEQAMFDTRRG